MSSPLLKMADFNDLVGSCVGGELFNVIGLGHVGVKKSRMLPNYQGVQTWLYNFGWAFYWGSGLVRLMGPLDYLKCVGLLPFANGPLRSGLSADGWIIVCGVFNSDGSFTARSSLGANLIDMLDRSTFDGPICGSLPCDLLNERVRREGMRSDGLTTVDRTPCLPVSRVSPRRSTT